MVLNEFSSGCLATLRAPSELTSRGLAGAAKHPDRYPSSAHGAKTSNGKQTIRLARVLHVCVECGRVSLRARGTRSTTPPVEVPDLDVKRVVSLEIGDLVRSAVVRKGSMGALAPRIAGSPQIQAQVGQI